MTQPSDEAANRPPTGGPVPAPQGPGYGPPPGNGPPSGFGPPPGYGPPPGHRPPPGYPPGPYYPPPPPLSPGGVPLADFGSRLLAYLIDVAIITGVTLVVAIPAFIVFFLVAAPFGADDVNADGTLPPDFFFGGFVVGAILLEVGLLLFVIAAFYVYTVEMSWRTGQTVGKRVMKLRVVPLDPRLRLTRGMATRRWAVQFVVGAIVPLFSYLDGFWQLWDKPFLQTLHDKAAQTVVVKVSA